MTPASQPSQKNLALHRIEVGCGDSDTVAEGLIRRLARADCAPALVGLVRVEVATLCAGLERRELDRLAEMLGHPVNRPVRIDQPDHRLAVEADLADLAAVGLLRLHLYQEGVGDAALGVVGPSQWEPGVAYNEEAAKGAGLEWFGLPSEDFVADYKAAYNEEPSYHAAGGYAAALTLQKAIEDAGSLDTDTTAAGGHGMHVNGTVAGRDVTLSDGTKMHGAAPGANLVSLSTGAVLFIVGADARAKALGARLVAMPGRPGAVIADVFLSVVADD